MSFLAQHSVPRVINALGTSTITGANIAPREVIEAAAEMLGLNVEIDVLQRAACGVIAKATGAEAGCVTSSASSALAICAAAAMTGPDLARIVSLPNTAGLRNEVVLAWAHDVNFGGRVSQMIRLAGARVIPVGTANHCDLFHYRGAIGAATAAVFYVVNGAVPSNADLAPLADVAALAREAGVPVVVDAAAEMDVRPFLAAGASLVITSGQKAMGAPTSGLICGRKDLIRACYLQNWGIGRAMKVGKEGIAGLMAAVERWYSMPRPAYEPAVRVLSTSLKLMTTGVPHRVAIDLGQPALRVANLLREGDPPVWVNSAEGDHLVLDLRALLPGDAEIIARRIREAAASADQPRDNVPYHDLYWSEARLLAWPD